MPNGDGSSNTAAIIAAGAGIVASLITGYVSYAAAKDDTQKQIQSNDNSHAKDIASAIHDALPYLTSSDDGQVKMALASLYFLGQSNDERTHIIETVGSADTPRIRNAILYVFSIDPANSPAIAKNFYVQNTVIKGNRVPTVTPSAQPTIRDIPADTKPDALDHTISLLNGEGWVYLGLGPKSGPASLEADESIKQSGPVTIDSAVQFKKTVNFRKDAPDNSGGFSNSLGTVQSGDRAVILQTKSYEFNNHRNAIWGEVFLCGAPQSPNIERPAAATACPHLGNPVSGS